MKLDIIANDLNIAEADALIIELAGTYHCTVEFNMFLDDPNMRFNHGCIAGCDEIFLSLFDNSEIKIAAFLHELGHSLEKDYPRRLWESKLANELKCWDIARDLAWKHHIVISDKAWAWGCTQALGSCYWFDNERGNTVLKTRESMHRKLEQLERFFRESQFIKKDTL